jgi:hypothetical protein
MALTLKRAIEASTKFKVASFGPDEPDNPGIVFVGVGTNSRLINLTLSAADLADDLPF